MQITILCPDSCKNEREYIFDIVLSRFLGLNYAVEYTEASDVKIKAGELEISCPDIFLPIANKNWLEKKSMPANKFPVYFHPVGELDTGNIPAWFYPPHIENNDESLHPVYKQTNNRIDLHFDLFGCFFFLISRYEEVVSDSLDQYERFPANESVLNHDKLYLRPIVNEYLSVLITILKSIDSKLKLKQHQYEQVITCDIDLLSFPPVRSRSDAVKFIASQAIRNRSILHPFRISLDIAKSRLLGYRFDPYNTFESLLRRSEETDSALIFYLMSGDTDSDMDGNYSLDDKNLIDTVKRLSLHDRVSFGLHSSFNAYQNGPEIKRQKIVLERFFEKHAIERAIKHNRQHYLRWNGSTTPKAIDEAGFDYDSTLCFAETSGFRSSTCYDYPLYDLNERRPLSTIETPLTVMDGSLLQPKYLGLNSADEASDYIRSIKNQCIKYGGKFTLLWHNSSLSSELEKEVFLRATTNKVNAEVKL